MLYFMHGLICIKFNLTFNLNLHILYNNFGVNIKDYAHIVIGFASWELRKG